MMTSERPKDVFLPNEVPKKRGSLSRFVMPFRSSKKASPASSLNGSPRSSVDVDYSQDSKQRRLSKAPNSSNVSAVTTRSSLSSASSVPNKLRKQSTVSPQVTKTDEWDRDRVTGEKKDPTNMLHSLAHDFDGPQHGKQPILETEEPARPALDFVSILPARIWRQAISSLELEDETSLSLSAKPFRDLSDPQIFRYLNDPSLFRARCNFLARLNYALPNHLLCYICGRYHIRIQPGKETLRPTNIANPLFNCPYANSIDPAEKVSRHRITFGRSLPYPFVQLVTRHHHFGPSFGIPADTLSKRYKDKEEIGTWSHQTRYAMIDDHLYMRVVSTAFAQPNLPPSGMRHLLYSREDFTPFFSVCAHWRDGELMPACKCALGHIPAPLEGSGLQRVAMEAQSKLVKPRSQIVTQCERCKALRRCPECPTEYLIEVRLQEDKTEKDLTKFFKQSLIVTRWSDLGDGSAPWSAEWAAIQGDLDHLEKEERYDSFKELGRRAISGTFESWFNPEQVPPQRLLSLNPGGERLGEKGHTWY